MSDIVIERGVPMPAHGQTKYPFARMQVGDSFYMEARRTTVASSASQWSGRNPGWGFSTRTEGTGTRVWCIARPDDDRGGRVGGAAA